MPKLFRFLFLLICCTLLHSCRNQVEFEQYQTVEENIWSKEKAYYFTINIDDISKPYDITLLVRNNNRYPYQNLWLFVMEEQPIGPLQRDTIECMLADDFGKWYGHGISLFHLEVPLKKSVYFPHKGQYTFGVRQGMRDSSIIGIQEIGLRLEKSPNAPSEKHLSEEI